MIAAVESEAITPRPVLDPREPPPQILKDVFKRFQKLPPGDIDADLAILDFNREGLSHGVEQTGAIEPEVLSRVYQKFMGDGYDDCEEQPIYSSKSLPGLLILPSFLPPSIQKALLSRLLHRDLSDPVHQTNIHMFHDLPYPNAKAESSSNPDSTSSPPSSSPSFFTYPPTSTVTLPPKNSSTHKPLTINKFLAKSLRWITLGGQYDWTAKVYPSSRPPPFPSDIKDLLEDTIAGTGEQMQAQAAIVNLYSPGDTLSLHRDVSEESDAGLVSVSLGCECLFVVGLGEREDGGDNLVVRLRSGDAVFMSKETRFAWHGVPKIIRNTCPEYLEDWPAGEEGEGEGFKEWRGWMRGKRVNLNVRQMFD